MPITPYLNGQRFDFETKRVLGVAFEMVLATATGVKQAMATKILDLAKAGERNPDFVRTSLEGHPHAAAVVATTRRREKSIARRSAN